MHAETARLGHRIHKARERRAAGERVVISLRIELARRERCGVALDAPRHRGRAQARAVDQGVAFNRLATLGVQHEAAASSLGMQESALQGEHRAVRLRIAEVREHERMAVDDPGGRRVERGDAGELGLERERLRARHPDHVADAVGMRLLPDRLELSELRFVRRHDELARALVRHAMAHAVLVEQALAFHAAERLERAFRVVDAGVDHLRIARAGVRAEGLLGLEDHHLSPRGRQGARHREADDPRAQHHRVKLFHVSRACRRGKRPRRRARRRSPSAARCRRRPRRARH